MVDAGDDSGESTEKLIIQVDADDCTDVISRLCDFVDDRTCHAVCCRLSISGMLHTVTHCQRFNI